MGEYIQYGPYNPERGLGMNIVTTFKEERTCKQCGQSYVATTRRSKYCSESCRRAVMSAKAMKNAKKRKAARDAGRANKNPAVDEGSGIRSWQTGSIDQPQGEATASGGGDHEEELG